MSKLLQLLFLPVLLLAGCALQAPREIPDQLSMVVSAATLRVERSAVMFQRGQLPAEVAAQRLARAAQAERAMQEALQVIQTCESRGGCDLASLRRELSLSALDQLEAHLLQAGELDAAEAAGAARIVLQLMSASAAPPAGGGSYAAALAPMVARFSAAVAAFRTVVGGRPA